MVYSKMLLAQEVEHKQVHHVGEAKLYAEFIWSNQTEIVNRLQ